MGDNIKGSTMVHVFHSFMTDSRGDLFNELLNPGASMLKVTEMVACPTFMSHMLDESLLNLRPSRDSHVRYDLSHSSRPPPPNVVTDH